MKSHFRLLSWNFVGLIVTGGMVLPAPVFNVLGEEKPSVQNIEFISGIEYRGGRKKSLHRTTSSVTLPDLNAILSPVPLETKQVIPRAKVVTAKVSTKTAASSKQKVSEAGQTTPPRYGYGSGEEVPRATVDPRIPIDPGYDTEPVPRREPVPAPPLEPGPVGEAPISPPAYQAPVPNLYPFGHGYYPRTYHYSTPYAPYPVIPYYGGGYGYCPLQYGGGIGYGIYPSRAPLRGSYTSSRNYLSGFRSPFLKFRFSF